MMFANTVDFRLSLDFFDSGLYTRTAVARLTLALAKLSCFAESSGCRPSVTGSGHDEGTPSPYFLQGGDNSLPHFFSEDM